MRVTWRTLSETAARLEAERERDFFALLFILNSVRPSVPDPVDGVEWRLTCDCLDSINGRYADTSFLMGFTACRVMRGRSGRTFLARFGWPIYVGLVMYDLDLRHATRAPALQYWNSICTLDTPVGRFARLLHTPACFYEAATREEEVSTRASPSPSSPSAPSSDSLKRSDASFFTRLVHYVPAVASSLLLTTVLSNVFEGSSWRQRANANTEVTGLVIHNRFFTWNVLEARHLQLTETGGARMVLMELPRFSTAGHLRRSFESRDLIMEKSSLGGKMWYGAHFFVLRLLEEIW